MATGIFQCGNLEWPGDRAEIRNRHLPVADLAGEVVEFVEAEELGGLAGEARESVYGELVARVLDGLIAQRPAEKFATVNDV